MSVHYKFKSALEYDTVTFDGLHISVKDLKKAIIHQKRIGKNTDFDLQVTNAQTKEVYNDENALIPKNTSLVIARVPMAAQAKGKPWEGYGTQAGSQTPGLGRPEDCSLSKAVDLTQLDASEDDKIRAMMTQSTLDYDPSNYMKIRGSNQVGVVPTHYRCFKCHQPGHWIKDCPLGHGQEPMEIKKSTGIPRSFMVPVEGPMVPGAMMTPTGQYAVPVLDHQAYNEGTKTTVPSQEAKPEIPEDLLCSICKDLLTDAVMIPCCGNSFCDECIRTVLLESEDHECPDCHEKDISPGTLIPNRFLRNSVSNFKNETGYHKRQQYRNATIAHSEPVFILDQPIVTEFKPIAQEPIVHPAESTTTEMQSPSPVVKQEQIKPDTQTSKEPERTADSLKPIISEADSTESTKTVIGVVKEESVNVKPIRVSPTNEGPPGVVSPALVKTRVASRDAPPGVDTSPNVASVNKGQAITSVGSGINHHRVKHHASQNSTTSRNPTATPDHPVPNRQYIPPAAYIEPNSRAIEERPGTPTVDEPGMGPPGYAGPDVNYSDAPPPGLHPTTTTLPPSQHMHPPPQIQGPPSQSAPGTYATPPATHQPPPGHYPPNNAPPPAGYRMPPPGHPDFNRVGTNTGYGNASHSLPRILLISNLDPSVPPPTVPPSLGSFTPRPIYDPTRPPAPYDPHRPPVHGAPPPGYPSYPPGPRASVRPFPPPRHMQPPPPGMIHRPPTAHPPPTVIDDPLEAFNRMLREKDERDRRARQSRRVSRSRSYSRSRSSSRSFSRSPRSRSRSPPPRNRHRSRTRSPPLRNRRTPRSRSRSFTMSRSRSFSRSPSFRGSPGREYSPRRRPPSRYRSPMNRNSPPRYRYKDNRPILDRDRDRIVDRERSDRDRTDRDRGADRERDRDYQFYDGPGAPPADYEYENNYERERGSGRPRPPLLRNPRYGIPPVSRKEYPMNEPFYPQSEMCPPAAYPPHTNRYNSRGASNNYPPPLMSVKTILPVNISDRTEPPTASHRKYDDVAPPGVEQPPVPGFEGQRYESQRFPSYDRSRDDGPPGVDRYQRTSPGPEREEHRETDRPPRNDSGRDYRDGKPRDPATDEKERFERKYSPSPDKRHKSVSPRRSSRDRVSSPDKSRRRKRDDSPDRDRRMPDGRVESDRDRDKKEKRRETSEDEKSKKSKDKKKKKEKKEAERKKKKEKKEKKEQDKLKKAEEKRVKEGNAEKTDDNKDKVSEEKTETKSNVQPVFNTPKPEPKKEIKVEELEQMPKIDLYDDIPSDGIDNTVVQNYGKIEQTPPPEINKLTEDNLIETNDDDFDEPEVAFDGLELQANESDLKADFIEVKAKSNEMLAPMPELSKWEIDEDVPSTPEKANSNESKGETKVIFERPGKVVTSEVIKRAENAIFAKAINAIRPIEIKKISLDRAKLYSGEKEKPSSDSSISKEPVKNIQITIPGPGWNLEDIPPPGTDLGIKGKSERSSSKTSPPPNRLSVKERLGCKVEELDRITKDDKPFERNRSRTLSPLSKRNEENGRNIGLGERIVEIEDRRRDNYRRSDDRLRYDQRTRHNDSRDRRGHARNERSKSRDAKSNYRDRNRQTDRKDYRRDDRRDDRKEERKDEKKDDKRTERSRSRNRSDRRHIHNRDERHRDEKNDVKEKDKTTSRSRRSKSRSESRDRKDSDKRKKSRDKKHKKEKEKEKDKGKKYKNDDAPASTKTVESKVEVEIKTKSEGVLKNTEDKSSKAKPVYDKRKSTLDEASFEPDYDLESESEKEENGKLKSETSISKKRDRSKSTEKKTIHQESIPKKRKTEEPEKKIQKESSSSDSSDSSSDEKHKKKHKKHKKKKSRRDSSSSSSSSESDSSVDKKSKKRHKSSKKIKKKKKSKHK